MSEQEEKVVDNQETEDTTNYEDLARADGWVSQEEWVEQGRPEHLWKPAKDFYEVGQQILPVVNSKNKRLEREVNELKDRIERMARASAKTVEAQRLQYEKDLKAERAKAIRDGDGERVNELDDELATVRAAKEPEPREVRTPDPITVEAFENFRNRNNWYGFDRAMTAAADAMAEEIKMSNPTISGPELLLKTEARMNERFNLGKTKTPAPTVESGTRNAPRPAKGKTYDALPKDAKDAVASMLKSIPASQKEAFKSKYVEHYFTDNN